MCFLLFAFEEGVILGVKEKDNSVSGPINRRNINGQTIKPSLWIIIESGHAKVSGSDDLSDNTRSGTESVTGLDEEIGSVTEDGLDFDIDTVTISVHSQNFKGSNWIKFITSLLDLKSNFPGDFEKIIFGGVGGRVDDLFELFGALFGATWTQWSVKAGFKQRRSGNDGEGGEEST